jgi:type II secretory ATPase GspE/PulE/Tfp pilus assembly ATPase PilB-like protein
MILCVGPTGSGKTTTLHSAMGYINTPERKIWTAEDPIEITQQGLRQVQVNPRIDWTFAKALRAFLRADPDVIMVGEIRDKETAGMAIEASLTGHLVMSTLHTNSAAETVTRLLDMGMDPFNFADALLVVLAQRLVRRFCGSCVTRPARPDEIDELLADYMQRLRKVEGRRPRTRAGRLAPALRPRRPAAGARGQGLRQVRRQRLSRPRRRARADAHDTRHPPPGADRRPAEEIQHAALAAGLRTLRQDGIEKVWAGVTSIGEVRATTNA